MKVMFLFLGIVFVALLLRAEEAGYTTLYDPSVKQLKKATLAQISSVESRGQLQGDFEQAFLRALITSVPDPNRDGSTKEHRALSLQIAREFLEGRVRGECWVKKIDSQFFSEIGGAFGDLEDARAITAPPGVSHTWAIEIEFMNRGGEREGDNVGPPLRIYIWLKA